MKIAKLHIESFRGIPNKCDLDFCDKQGKAKSIIIYGGNGSGKSSIVDAIEYNLQGRIERSLDIRNSKRPSALNLLPDEYVNAYTKIEFDDSTINERTINVERDEDNNRLIIYSSSEDFHRDFKEVPIALRRNEIISYNDQDEKLRQYFIATFIYSDFVEEIVSKNSEYKKITDKIKTANEEYRTILNRLSKLIDYSIDDIRNNNEGAENFIRRKYSPKGTDFQSLKNSFKNNQKLVNKTTIDGERFDKFIELSKHADEILRKIEKLRKEGWRCRESYRKNNLPEYLDKEYYQHAEEYLTDAFVKISNIGYIEKIRLSRGEKTNNSLSIRIQLRNKKEVSPTEIFSEANYDLMILLLYLSLIRVGVEYKNQAKVLIIDDVLQSVDAAIRTKFMTYVFENLSDWQFIITCHDKLWLNQLKHLFKCNGLTGAKGYKEFHITNWSFETGPIIRVESTNAVDESILQALSTNNMKIISAVSGSMLEKICNELTMNMHFSIERAWEDKYELENLWNAVKARFKKDEELSIICKEIDQVYYLRNTYGAHYNYWAENVNDEEVLRFANLVQKLYEKTFCPECYSWIQKQKDCKDKGKCSCGTKIVTISK